ncbi:MAG TPA: response regulator [Phormidium sp.]
MMSTLQNNLPLKKDREILEGLQILAVDDNEDSLLLTSVILEDYGITVTTAISASEAFEKFKQSKPDILICDITMPEKDGYWLIREIKKLELEASEQTPAIALTACARKEDRILAIEAGFQDHLTKPIEPDNLVQAVVTIVKRERK